MKRKNLKIILVILIILLILLTVLYINFKYNKVSNDKKTVQKMISNNYIWNLYKIELVDEKENSKAEITDINDDQITLTFHDDEVIVCILNDECVTSKFTEKKDKYIIEANKEFYFNGTVNIINNELVLIKNEAHDKTLFYFRVIEQKKEEALK